MRGLWFSTHRVIDKLQPQLSVRPLRLPRPPRPQHLVSPLRWPCPPYPPHRCTPTPPHQLGLMLPRVSPLVSPRTYRLVCPRLLPRSQSLVARRRRPLPLGALPANHSRRLHQQRELLCALLGECDRQWVRTSLTIDDKFHYYSYAYDHQQKN